MHYYAEKVYLDMKGVNRKQLNECILGLSTSIPRKRNCDYMLHSPVHLTPYATPLFVVMHLLQVMDLLGVTNNIYAFQNIMTL